MAPGAAERRRDSEAPRSALRFATFGTGALIAIAALLALGTWQVHRLAWKEALIARVDRNMHAAPVEAPGPAAWPGLGPENEYRRVTATGTFLNNREALVGALTERGGGFWVLTPLKRPDGSIVLVNRGFVPEDRRDPEARAAGNPSGPVTVVGLLRLTETGGSFLRRNDPAGGRWFSRDVAAIAAADHLTDVAPYFIDADASPNPGGFPIGGLTVVAFPNNHLVYALTWYALAAILAALLAKAIRDRVARHPPPRG